MPFEVGLGDGGVAAGFDGALDDFVSVIIRSQIFQKEACVLPQVK